MTRSISFVVNEGEWYWWRVVGGMPTIDETDRSFSYFWLRSGLSPTLSIDIENLEMVVFKMPLIAG